MPSHWISEAAPSVYGIHRQGEIISIMEEDEEVVYYLSPGKDSIVGLTCGWRREVFCLIIAAFSKASS